MIFNKEKINELMSLAVNLWRQKTADFDLVLKTTSLRFQVEHTYQVLDNSLLLVDLLKKEGIEVDEDIVYLLAIFHDIAKYDKDGQIDVFCHHLSENVYEVLREDIRGCGSIYQRLLSNGLSEGKIAYLVRGISYHSSATSFIRRKALANGINLPDINEPGLPIEYCILADADVMDQARFNKGFRKVVVFRLWDTKFIAEDTENGQHDIKKTLESAIVSAREAVGAMVLDPSKKITERYYDETKRFLDYLMTRVDEINQFGTNDKMIHFNQEVENWKSN